MLNKRVIIDWLKNNAPHKLIQRRWYYHSYFKKSCEIINGKEPKEFEIYTVAFNNDRVIDYQIKLMKKNFKDEHQHVVVDNSSDEEISKKIREICIDNDTMYIRLPKNTLFSSQSHALALNYIYRNIILKRENVRYFWFLDHDIFPIKETTILSYIKKQKMYGYLMDKERIKYARNAWNLRPGFCFFDKSMSRKFDFRPTKSLFPLYALDTWGKNYKLIYKKYDKNKLQFPFKELFWVHKDFSEENIEYSKVADYLLAIEYSQKKHFVYTYEYIKDKERIHRWWTYFFWTDELAYKKYLNLINLFFDKLDKFL